MKYYQKNLTIDIDQYDLEYIDVLRWYTGLQKESYQYLLVERGSVIK